MKKNYDYTAKDRVERQRERMKEHDIKRKELYAHDDDWPDIKKYAQKKLNKRLKDADKNLTP